MRAIIGLGNPGNEYENTRHNIGFAVIDAVASKMDIILSEGKGEYLMGSKKIGNNNITLVKPLTYMNNSGIAVKEIIDYFHLDLWQILVVVDDFNLPLGTTRIRLRGSAGGHNGLYSIIYHLGSEDFPRLRCGIADESMPKYKSARADFVLSSFDRSENKIVQQMIEKARDIVLETTIQDLPMAFSH